ncbi:hypothetical protein ANACOL_04106 [Anaerotruncus colihominis DSM 17241]|uniref:Uncharacterized protein n=1 Tax=Anaerotruncus colihominis DSM 17241 TaxID=445972 RepID=B0PH84_9FIRM|nr:hypothetical protein ANACOL_04106 [Anaerotruncus colihominis DSM 17241]
MDAPQASMALTAAAAFPNQVHLESCCADSRHFLIQKSKTRKSREFGLTHFQPAALQRRAASGRTACPLRYYSGRRGFMSSVRLDTGVKTGYIGNMQGQPPVRPAHP